jgi:hypothetical protein
MSPTNKEGASSSFLGFDAPGGAYHSLDVIIIVRVVELGYVLRGADSDFVDGGTYHPWLRIGKT